MGHGVTITGTFENVKPCPFCGGTHIDVAYHADSTVMCICTEKDCRALGPRVFDLTIDDAERKRLAIERWDKRS